MSQLFLCIFHSSISGRALLSDALLRFSQSSNSIHAVPRNLDSVQWFEIVTFVVANTVLTDQSVFLTILEVEL